MAFPQGPRRGPTPTRVRSTVFAVGRRVLVACAGDRSAPASLTDDTGAKALATLGDGAEVAIVAWRPGWGGAARYHVRVTDSGLEGWLPVGNLRAAPPVPAAIHVAPRPAVPPVPPRAAKIAAPARRSGARATRAPAEAGSTR